jgi:glyoxylase-like metal-dependent hydrolase (beta-lactamase superfamily II)
MSDSPGGSGQCHGARSGSYVDALPIARPPRAVWAGGPDCLLTAQPTWDFDPGQYRRRPARPTQVLIVGDRLDVGDRRFDVLHLPGHSTGSICLYERETAILFSGDVIYDDELIDDVLPGTSRAQYIESIKQLMAMDLRRVLPGHGDPLTGDAAHQIAAHYLANTRG